MHRRLGFFLLGCITCLLVGCGDSPHIILRDTITMFNEIMDEVSLIPDDDSAEEAAEHFIKHKIPVLKKRVEKVQKRLEQFKDNDKEAKMAKDEAIKFWADEIKMMGDRFKYAFGRLDKIAYRLSEERAQQLRSPPKKEAKVGNKKALEPEIDFYATKGIVLVAVDPEDVCPKIYEMKKSIMQLGQGSKAVPQEKKEEGGR